MVLSRHSPPINLWPMRMAIQKREMRTLLEGSSFVGLNEITSLKNVLQQLQILQLLFEFVRKPTRSMLIQMRQIHKFGKTVI